MKPKILTPGEVDRLLQAGLRPVDNLAAALFRPNNRLAVRRLSAFPRFAMSQEEILELLASADEDAHRTAFFNLCRGACGETQCFARQRRYPPKDEVYTRLTPDSITPQVPVWLSEEDALDIVMPDIGVVLVGHDDFGCNVVCGEGETTGFEWIRNRADAVGLFLLDIPDFIPPS